MAKAKETCGRTTGGVRITAELVAELTEKAKARYDVEEMLRRRRARRRRLSET